MACGRCNFSATAIGFTRSSAPQIFSRGRTFYPRHPAMAPTWCCRISIRPRTRPFIAFAPTGYESSDSKQSIGAPACGAPIAMKHTPKRIVCLSAEAADWLQRIGAWDRVAGVTAFFTIPREAPPKPRVSGFSTARMEQIEKLKPDLVITFSDVQAPLAAELMRLGFTVLATNQRTLAETETTLALLARITDRETEAKRWLSEFRARLAPVEQLADRPRVYFEEWNDPLISGIAWI